MTRTMLPPKKRDWTPGTVQLGLFVRYEKGETIEFVSGPPGLYDEEQKIVSELIKILVMSPTRAIEHRALHIVEKVLDDEHYRCSLDRGLESSDHGWGWYWQRQGHPYDTTNAERAHTFEFEAGVLAAEMFSNYEHA